VVNDVFLTSKQEVADVLGMSVKAFERYLKDYPFHHSGAPGVVQGRWRVLRTYVFRWWGYVQRQQLRHPEARRLRPEEPPVVAEIRGR
jgi:hypothetical protein